MKIQFCDLCNESVPQGDLDRGRAVIRKGRVICSTCEKAMSGAGELGAADETKIPGMRSETAPAGTATSSVPGTAPEAAQQTKTAQFGGGAEPAAPAATASRGGGGGAGFALFLATFAVIGSVAGFYYLNQHILEQRTGFDGSLAEGRRLQGAAATELEMRVDRRMVELADAQAQAAQRLSEVAARSDESQRYLRDTLEQLRILVTGMEERLRVLEPSREGVARNERDIAKMAETVAGLHAEILRLSDRMLTARQAEPEPWVEEAPVETQETDRPTWWPHLAELASENSGARWQAVQALGDSKDLAVAEHLAPMLTDPDIFVRMATARILGDLRALKHIPNLIDALEDPEPSVREAAVVSLRGISGRDLRFDPDGREAERTKQVKAWREWWRRAEKDLVESGA